MIGFKRGNDEVSIFSLSLSSVEHIAADMVAASTKMTSFGGGATCVCGKFLENFAIVYPVRTFRSGMVSIFLGKHILLGQYFREGSEGWAGNDHGG